MTSIRQFLLSFLALCLLPVVGAFSLTLEDLLPEATANQLVQEGTLSREKFDTTTLNMVPRYAALQRTIETLRKGLDPNLAVESLRLYKKPAGDNWSAVERLTLYNGILSLSTLKGLEYYSKSRDRMRILYEASAVIDGPDTKKNLPDPVYRMPPIQLDLHARLKDSTFGDNIYKFTYYSYEFAFIVTQENLTTISYGIIPLVDKNKLRSVIAVFDAGPYLLVYAASLAKASMIPGMKQRAGESINNKAAAMLAWFFQKADKAFKKAG